MKYLLTIIGLPFRALYALCNIVIGCVVLIFQPSAWERDGGWSSLGQLGWWVLTSKPEGLWD